MHGRESPFAPPRKPVPPYIYIAFIAEKADKCADVGSLNGLRLHITQTAETLPQKHSNTGRHGFTVKG